ncbi:MAG TPA: ATP-binding protein [Candidatus Paceibacterota bacterium]|nr:ATP-binding protein [Candidatus Paceibacterota bacterium]
MAVAATAARLRIAGPTAPDWILLGSIFIGYFAAAWACLAIYFEFATGPALLWLPAGIGFAAVLFLGYRMAIPIFLAQLASFFLLNPYHQPLLGIALSLGYALEALLGVYALRALHFGGSLASSQDVLILVLVALGATMIEPALSTATQVFLGVMTIAPAVSFGRAWEAGIFSVLLIVPFILGWQHVSVAEALPARRREQLELIAAFVVLAAVAIFLFWSPYLRFFGISVIFFLPAVLVWIALRMHPRWMTAAIMLTSIIGIAGTLVTQARTQPLSTDLLTDQVYIGLVAAIFLLFAAIVEERRVAFQQLEEKLQVTSASDEAKSEFIAVLAHELRNPLAPLVSSLELLRLSPQTPEGYTAIANAQTQTVMMRRLLDDLLDTARIAQAKLQLQKEPVDAREALEQSVTSVQDYLRSQGHTLSTHIPQQSLLVDADPVRLKQIIINLLNNACKYTEPGGTITLSCAVDETTNMLTITVSDTGIGIPPDALDSLFQPFRQGAMPRTDRLGTGLGIGLYLTRQLVELHGGTIEASSDGPGRGSTFTVHLPLLTQVPIRYVPAEETRSASGSARRIMLVDDNQAFVRAMQQLLSHYGHETHAAHSGEEALAALRTFKPDVIVLDIGMPGMSGLEVASRIRESGWRGTIIGLSGYGQESDRERSAAAGFDHHLVKPVAAQDILALL